MEAKITQKKTCLKVDTRNFAKVMRIRNLHKIILFLTIKKTAATMAKLKLS